jgi:hypothetical protein
VVDNPEASAHWGTSLKEDQLADSPAELVFTSGCSKIVAMLGNMNLFTCVMMTVWLMVSGEQGTRCSLLGGAIGILVLDTRGARNADNSLR